MIKLQNSCPNPLNLNGFKIEPKYRLRDLGFVASTGRNLSVKEPPQGRFITNGKDRWSVLGVGSIGFNTMLVLDRPFEGVFVGEETTVPKLLFKGGSWWVIAEKGEYILSHPRYKMEFSLEVCGE